MPHPGLLEVCVDTPAGLHAARDGGADCIELCSALELGGLTPSPGLLATAMAGAVPVFVMIRPKAGDFVFQGGDVDVMRRDIDAVADAATRAGRLGNDQGSGVVRPMTGLVLGASTPRGRLSVPVLEALLRHAASVGLHHATLHRAFDLVPEPSEALEEAVALGFERILTSGGARRAPEGIRTLRALREQAAGRLEIMAGSGVNPDTMGAIMDATGIRELHASCRPASGSGRDLAPDLAPGPESEELASHIRCGELGFGANPVETDAGIVRKMKAILAARATGTETGEEHA